MVRTHRAANSREAGEADTTLHEDAFVLSFVKASKQERYRELLGNPRRRSDALHRLADRRDLDPQFATEIRPAEQTVSGISALLKSRGAPSECYVISEWSELDARILPLTEALQAVLGMGMGAVLSCVSGTVAYFEGEGPADRCILNRPGGRTKG